MSDVSDSILSSVKKVLGITEDYTAFDLDIIMHINTALTTLAGLGIGPAGGYAIDDASDTWGNFLGDGPNRMLYNSVKTYICLRVRMTFDPPATSFVLESFSKQVQELEWRLNVTREATDWIDPDPGPDCVMPVITGTI